MDVADVTRYARHISLPEIGPEGQARISAARVAVVGADLAAETAATYLRAAGCQVVEETLSVAEIDLIVRSGFDDTPLDAEAARLGLPFIAVRATPEAVDMVAFSGRVPSPDARPEVPFKAAGTPTTDDASAVLAGTLAAAEALQTIVREAAPFTPRIRHMRLPLDGREPLVQEIGAPAR